MTHDDDTQEHTEEEEYHDITGCLDYFLGNDTPPEASELLKTSDPLEDQRDIPDGHEDEAETLSGAVSVLNEEHAVVMSGGDTVVMTESFDPVRSFPDIYLSSFASIKNKYLNRKLANPFRSKNQAKFRDLGSLWLEHPDRREYEKIIFDPAQEPEPRRNGKTYWNLFQGFPIKPKQGDWSRLENHIFKVICDSDLEVYKWLWNWQRAIFQIPGWKNPTAITMISGQGTGKGTWADYLGALCGQHYKVIQKGNNLTGKFNYRLKDAIIVFADEVTWGGDKNAEGVLKTMVTQDTLDIEPKYKDSFEVKNCINLIIASNNEWVIPAGLDDRRFCVLRVAEIDELKDNPEYFKPIRQQMKNGGLEAMLWDMLEAPLTETELSNLRKIPRTQELFKQILLSMNPVHKYWFECLSRGRLLESDADWTEYVSKSAFYAVFADSKYAGNYIPPPNQMKNTLQELMPKGYKIKQYRPRIGGARPDCYKFPSLNDCRLAFESKIKMPVNWEKEGVTETDEL